MPYALCLFQHQVDRARDAAPLRKLIGEMSAAFACQRVVARSTIVFCHAPLRFDEALPLEPIECWIQRPLSELQDLFGPLLDPLGDAPPVHWFELQGLEHQHVERPLQDVGLLFGHGVPFD